MRKFTFLLILLFLFLGKNQLLQAQIVNIEDRRSTLKDTSGWFGYLDIGAQLIQNTKSITNISGSLRLEYLKSKSRLLLLSNYNLIRVNNDRFIDNGFQHFRFNFLIKEKIEYEVFAQAQFNNQVRITLRGLLGTGLRFHILEINKGKIFWGLSYMFEYDEIKFQPESIQIFRDNRMSTYLSLRLKPNDNFSLSNTTYYQPVLKDFSDVRLSSQTTLKFSISKRLTFTSIFNITNDTRVADDVPHTYYSWRNGIRIAF